MTTAIPKPPGVPLLGNIFDVNPNNTWISLKQLADKYGEIFKINALGHQIVFVANAELCSELCDETRFRKCVAGPVVEIRHSVHASLFTAFENESIWGVHHRIIAPTLSKDFVQNYFDEIRQCAAELTAKWKTKSTGGPLKITPFDELNRLSLEACTLAFHGIKLNCIMAAQEHPMIAAMEGATSEAMKRPNRPRLLNWWYQSKFDKDTKTMRTYAADVLKQRKENPQPERRDMLYALMNGEDPETGERLNDTQIIDEIVTMPIGASTAPGLISMAIYYLCKNPDVATKAREEIGRVLGDGPFTHEKISDLTYCDAIVKESLRLSAAAPGFNIEPLPDTKGPITLANGKYEIPANQMMIIVLAAVNRDPAVFDNPLEFRPERMLPEKFESYPIGVKKWFGNGKRECIGKHYAWLWNVVTVVTILKDVDFEMADSTYQLKQNGWFNLRAVGFEVKVK